MPHLQLDVPARFPIDVKRTLAACLGQLYGEIMETTPDIVDVTFREHGEGGVWRCARGGPVPAAVLSCDIRRGRTPEQRVRLGVALHEACVRTLALDPLTLNVEFTQHDGDEIFGVIEIDGVLRGGFAKDWSPSETETSIHDAIRAERRSGAGSF
jgi:hypothetical protein